jgi:hypothetical protein
MTEKTPEEMTDDFLAHLDAGDYIIEDDTARKMPYLPAQPYAPIKANLLLAIVSYTETKNAYTKPSESAHSYLLHEMALRVVIWLRKARMENLIEENPSFRTQIEVFKQENERLQELNFKLTNDNIHLKKQVEALHETINRITNSGLEKASGESQ